jgi:hypothetical protein
VRDTACIASASRGQIDAGEHSSSDCGEESSRLAMLELAVSEAEEVTVIPEALRRRRTADNARHRTA